MDDEWKSWSNCTFDSKELLPQQPGIYVITDKDFTVWYVGLSKSLKNRWQGTQHHRYKQLRRRKSKLQLQIYYKLVATSELEQQEKYYIAVFKPRLNGSKVTKVLPKTATGQQELIHLLKVLNNKTQLFPYIRSVIIGYKEEVIENTRYYSVTIAVNFNDIEFLYKKAYRKGRRWDLKTQCWKICEDMCGQAEGSYLPATVLSYLQHPWAIQFACLDWKFINYLEHNPQNLQRVSLLGVETFCLKDFQAFEQVGLKLPFLLAALNKKLTIEPGLQRLDNSVFVLHHLPSMQLATSLANLNDCLVVQHASEEYLNHSLTETWSELEELMDGEVRKLEGILVYPEEGLEIEILKAENGRYYVRELTAALFLKNCLYTDLLTPQGELNQQQANQLVGLLSSYANSVQSMKWKGYRWRFEKVFIQWNDVDIETYSCLVPLGCFCDMIVDQYSKQGWSEERWNTAANTSYAEMLTSRDWNGGNVRAVCLYKFLALHKNTFDKLLEHCQVNGHGSTDIMLDDSTINK
jgi:predicted GIY-YIG superfamily endonuclease